ncbi:MAG: lysine--tRNA ligase [Bauldia sp.]
MPEASIPPLDLSPDLVAAAGRSKAWPFEEAQKIVERIRRRGAPPAGGAIIFETGYGPSGLPHIGTFGEVARTTMVRTAFRLITEDAVPTRLICFSDDMDGLRKVPGNVPNQAAMAAYLNQPLTKVPDPFGEYESFGSGNNARLRKFLDRFGFAYEFMSATDTYKSGRFDATLLKMLALYDDVMAIMLPSLREERQQSYAPFLPLSPVSGAVLQVPILERNVAAGTVVFRDPDNGDALTEVPVTGGHVKCQWKADWAMRWAALGIDYEMSGKDLIDSVKLSTRICAALGVDPPEGFNYELFLDENGQKISKSKGNGLTIDEWLTYAAPESLSLYMFHRPRAAKKLYFDVIPKAVDEYFDFLDRYPAQSDDQKLGNPVWHIHAGRPPKIDMPVTFTMLLNLASASNTQDKSVLWGFIQRHVQGVTPATHPKLDELIGYAVRYYNDFVLPKKVFRAPDEVERAALAALDARLASLPADADPETVQTAILDVARAIPRYQDKEREGPHGGPGVSVVWFSTLYQILLGQDRGPRFGSFAAIYGIPETRALIAQALAGELVATA